MFKKKEDIQKQNTVKSEKCLYLYQTTFRFE